MDAGLTFRLRKRTVAALLLITAALAMVISRPDKPGELPVYMKAAERILHGEQIYRTDEVSAFTYPPFFVLPMLPLAPLSPIARARVWWFANLGLAGVILFVVARLIWPIVARGAESDRRLRWVLALAVAVLAGQFLMSPLEYMVTARPDRARPRRAGGLCDGAGEPRRLGGRVHRPGRGVAKATPLLFLPLLCWQRRYRCGGVLFGRYGRGHIAARRALSVAGRASLESFIGTTSLYPKSR